LAGTFAIAQTPTKQPALRLSRTKNLHFAKATFPGFSANEKTLQEIASTNNITPKNLQNNTHKTNDRDTWTPLKTGGELWCSRWISSSCLTSR
jgi:hypothetical protein